MGSHVAAPVLTPNLKYDPLTDFVPIGITAHSPAVIIARKDFPAKDLKEFVAALRDKGDALKQGHGGIGASSHMACVLFNAAVGTKPTLVAYRGSAPALNDVVGGHIDFLCEQSVSVAESVLAGSVKAYGHRRRATPGAAAGRADRQGAGRGLRDERLGRPVRAQGHAARGDRQAGCRARQVARRAHGA